ncbi:electron transport complex protein RnfD [Alkalibacterium subtropicum]|uniref:Ion-translocating oxidoreductase complex subunit D n=1 Tax=Alkalibacterium subtropicum TaxID=753702 RepID=A0A1I1HVP1_9LACT|nr:RnfABCDGE type electron transport complex subunit D [Alkalibacterium subtropicum]SFC27941.1 electron transport complex protein RnfD [Alkalibacterium subtropicum]
MAQAVDVKGKLRVGPSPHIRTARTSSWVMSQVMIAMIPPTIAATYFFGWWVLVMVAIGIVTAVASEYIYQKLTYKPITIHDNTAAVTGMLIGLSLPVTAPIWMIMFGSIFAIIIVKQMGGGVGKNYFNPAVAGRVAIKAFFTPWLANWVLPGGFFGSGYRGVDAVSTATPLEYLGDGAQTVAAEVPGLWDLFMGFNLGGNVGETSKLAILIGMLYLIFRRIINPKIPILYILTTTVVMGLWANFNFDFMMAHALTGTLFFAATYMATDYSSGSLTPEGKTVFAIGAGLLTAFFRIAFNYPGGVGFAILIMNALAPSIDSKLMPRIYGHKKRPAVKFNRQSENN